MLSGRKCAYVFEPPWRSRRITGAIFTASARVPTTHVIIIAVRVLAVRALARGSNHGNDASDVMNGNTG